jgi:hypothetical protein
MTSAMPDLARAPMGFVPAGSAPIAPGGSLWLSREKHLRLIVSVDGGYLHASISHPDRYPTWAEIMRVRDWIFPAEMEVVMVLARRSEYVNLHPNCFHLWQSRCGEEGR